MNQGKLKIALICFDNPFLPPAEGGKRAMMSKIYSLLNDSSKYEVDIYLHNKKNEGVATDFKGVEHLANSITQFPMNSTIHSFWGFYPICVNKRFSHECSAILKNNMYDVAIYEGEQVSKYRLKNVVNAKYNILYMHDIESVYRAEVSRSQKNFLMSLINHWESKRFIRIEKQIKNKFDYIWFISKEECDTFGKWSGVPEKCDYMPFPALELANNPIDGQKAPRLLYVGDLSINHNYRSMEWFSREVFPLIKEKCPEAELMVVGRICDENSKTLRDLGANVCGYVDDLDKAFEEAACIVAPVLFGAGVKVKTIDALARGQIVITTSKGIEGTDLQNGKHLIAEDNPIKMADICCKVLKDREKYLCLAKDGLEYVKQVHTIEHQAEIIDRTISLLMEGNDTG